MRKQKDILYLVLSGFVLTVIWIAATVYHSHATSTISETLLIEVQPIEPQFDQATLEKIKTRTKIDPRFEVSPQIASQSAPSPTPLLLTPTNVLSPSATPSGR